MNEQIKLLAEQAYELCGKHSNNYNGPAFAEKFAELIIRESREWVGLTNEEKKIICEANNIYHDGLIEDIEAKLKEKNNP
jgi:hypothetical protein